MTYFPIERPICRRGYDGGAIKIKVIVEKMEEMMMEVVRENGLKWSGGGTIESMQKVLENSCQSCNKYMYRQDCSKFENLGKVGAFWVCNRPG